MVSISLDLNQIESLGSKSIAEKCYGNIPGGAMLGIVSFFIRYRTLSIDVR